MEITKVNSRGWFTAITDQGKKMFYINAPLCNGLIEARNLADFEYFNNMEENPSYKIRFSHDGGVETFEITMRGNYRTDFEHTISMPIELDLLKILSKINEDYTILVVDIEDDEDWIEFYCMTDVYDSLIQNKHFSGIVIMIPVVNEFFVNLEKVMAQYYAKIKN